MTTSREARSTPVPLNSVVPKDIPRLAAGDLVVPVDCKAQVIRDPARVRVAEVHDEDLPLIAASDVLVVRPDDGALDLAERSWLQLFLRTERCWEQLVDGWHVMHWLSPSDFGRILVPFPDAEFLEAVHAVSEARRRFQAWKDQAEAMLVSSVDAQDSDTARERLLDSSGIL